MKRILLLSTIFYPYPSVGSVRVTNWARILPQLGYDPLIICRDYGYRASAENLAANVHPGVKLLQFKNDGSVAPLEDRAGMATSGQRQLYRRLLDRSVGGLHKLLVPDVQILFWNRVYPRIVERAKEFRPDVILATAPAFSVLEIGRRLKQLLGVPFIADFRDPMQLDHRFRPQGWARVAWPAYTAFERRVYEGADAILHAVPLHARWARLKFPQARRKCATLRHPVPDDLASGAVAPIRSNCPTRRTVSVVGFIRPEVVEPLALAIRQLVDENPGAFDLELRLVGRPLDDPRPLQDMLEDRLVLTGRVRHDIAKGHIAGSDVLVNAVSSDRQKVINVSSKLFEYVAARKPIVAINPTWSDRKLLDGLGAQVVNMPTVENLRHSLQAALSMGEHEVSAAYDGFLEKHSWKRHCDQLSALLSGAISSEKLDYRELDLLASGAS